jgi:hypothetical protein
LTNFAASVRQPKIAAAITERELLMVESHADQGLSVKAGQKLTGRGVAHVLESLEMMKKSALTGFLIARRPLRVPLYPPSFTTPHVASFRPRLIASLLAILLAGTVPIAAPCPGRGRRARRRVYNGAMAAFQQGNWQAAAQGLEKFIALIVDPKQQGALHPIYYTLGAAYFNMENHAKAVEVFETYLKKFPNAERFARGESCARAGQSGKQSVR